jgi:hypothetical protein
MGPIKGRDTLVDNLQYWTVQVPFSTGVAVVDCSIFQVE